MPRSRKARNVVLGLRLIQDCSFGSQQRDQHRFVFPEPFRYAAAKVTPSEVLQFQTVTPGVRGGAGGSTRGSCRFRKRSRSLRERPVAPEGRGREAVRSFWGSRSKTAFWKAARSSQCRHTTRVAIPSVANFDHDRSVHRIQDRDRGTPRPALPDGVPRCCRTVSRSWPTTMSPHRSSAFAHDSINGGRPRPPRRSPRGLELGVDVARLEGVDRVRLEAEGVEHGVYEPEGCRKAAQVGRMHVRSPGGKAGGSRRVYDSPPARMHWGPARRLDVVPSHRGWYPERPRSFPAAPGVCFEKRTRGLPMQTRVAGNALCWRERGTGGPSRVAGRRPERSE